MKTQIKQITGRGKQKDFDELKAILIEKGIVTNNELKAKKEQLKKNDKRN